MYTLTSTLVESTYTGYNIVAILIAMACLIVFLYATTEIADQGEIKKGVRIVLACVLVAGLIFSYVPLQTNASAELTTDEEPKTYEIQNLEYKYNQGSEVTVQVTDSNVDRIKVFAVKDNTPTDQAERMQASPETTLELPENSESIVVITYDENGETVEETKIKMQESEENIPILDFKVLNSA